MAAVHWYITAAGVAEVVSRRADTTNPLPLPPQGLLGQLQLGTGAGAAVPGRAGPGVVSRVTCDRANCDCISCCPLFGCSARPQLPVAVVACCCNSASGSRLLWGIRPKAAASTERRQAAPAWRRTPHA